MRRKKLMAVAAAVGLLTAACSSSSSHTSASNASGGGTDTVTISNEQGQTWPCQFNPFNPSNNAESLGVIYEPLVFVNALKDAAETPMLASSYTWAADKKSIVFTIRDGVKWSDGQPMTAADVAFTFNLMKQNAALDLYALWTGGILDSVTAAGNQVTMNFKVAAQPYFYYFADR
jgi:peptide/nickel transport system substrate-binding protein